MTVEDRLAALEARVLEAEDHLAILNQLVSYGPLADSGSAQEAAALWVEGGGYNYSGGHSNGTRLEAPEQLVEVYEGVGHRSLMAAGCAHLTATPKVMIDGDSARAVGYTFVVLREGERWFPFRAAINEWTLRRTDDGWRIVERFNRTLSGSEESHEVMRRVLAQ